MNEEAGGDFVRLAPGADRADSAEPQLTAGHSEPPRFPVLDGVRGLAILLVLLHHYTQHVGARSVVDIWFLGFTNSTWLGVDLFFVLSGFLITGILFDARGKRRYFSVFWARRSLRIFPPYYLLLFGLFFVVPVVGARWLAPLQLDGVAAEHPAWFWLYGSNWLTSSVGWPVRPVSHLWSLAIEEQFYLVWPLIVFALPGRWLLRLLPVMILAAAALRFWLAAQGTQYSPVFVWTWARMDTFAAGGWVAIAIRDPIARSRLERWSLGGLLATGAGVVGLGYGPAGLDWKKWGSLESGLVYGLIAVFFALLISRLLVAREKPTRLQRIFSSRALGRIGIYSYAIYLFHLPLETLARGLGFHPSAHASILGSMLPVVLLYIGGNAVVVFVAAWLSWHGFEKFFMNLRTRFRHPV